MMEKPNPVIDKLDWSGENGERDKDIIGKPPSRFTRYGSGLILFIIIILLVFSYIIQLPEVIKGPVNIVPEQPIQFIKAAASGKLCLQVKEGDQVTTGTLLFSIDSFTCYQDIAVFKNYVLLQDSLNRKAGLFTRDFLPAQINPGKLKPLSDAINNAIANNDKSRLLTLLPGIKDSIADWEAIHLQKSRGTGRIALLRTNETVKENDTIMAMTGTVNNVFYGKVLIPVVNAARVKKGQEVTISLATHPARQFGTLSGVVESVAALPVDNKYEVTVLFPKGLVINNNNDLKTFLSFQGIATIVIEKKRLLGRIFNRLF